MKVRSLFFALYRDMMGAEQLVFELPEGSTVADLVAAVRQAADRRLPHSVVTAVNREYATLETRLRDGDEVAFIPPVAGG